MFRCVYYTILSIENKFRFSCKFNLLAITIKLDVSFFLIVTVLKYLKFRNTIEYNLSNIPNGLEKL